jgi:glutathione synthase
MLKKLGVIMDPISTINYKKDSTLAMLWEAEKRGYALYYFEQKDLFLRDGAVFGKSRELQVFHHPEKWFELGEAKTISLADLDIILMRKDPPFDREYVYTTYLLEHAEREGVFVLNKPQALRDANEKLFAAQFPQCCPPTLVTRSMSLLKDFFKEHKDIVCKPLDAMGGSSIFRLRADEVNANVIFETLTERESAFMMAQKFIPEITDGDKRILMIDGEAIPFALARVPGKVGDWRGNLAAGAAGEARPLTAKDRWICEQVGPVLREKGLYFVGLDIIGDFLTEINVTSPTCIRELDEQCNIDISAVLFDRIEKLISKK